MLVEPVRAVLTTSAFLALWSVLVVASLVVLTHDLLTAAADIAPLTKAVWGLTTLYSGPLGIAVY